MSDYVSDLIRKFDKNSDGLLTLSELTEGLKKIGIFLTGPETQALMAKLDLNRDGEVSGDEILKVLSSVGGVLSSSSSVDAIINKLTANAKGFASMRDYAKNLIKRFDRDNDGIITFNELTEGLSKMGINANSQDKRELMERLDIDRDGQITENEIIRVLGGGDANGVVEDTLRKIVGGAKNYKSITEYVKDLVRRFDSNSDGLLSVYEL
jgi:Ca2+-binding EF-hand superfamily protein